MPIEIVSPAEASTAAPAHDVPVAPREAFRGAPLLAVLDSGDDRLIAVGQFQILVHRGAVAQVTAVVHAMWAASVRKSAHGDPQARDLLTDWRAIDRHDDLERLLTAWTRPALIGGADPEAVATSVAKDLAERSRNAVATLRSCRYGLERLLGETLRGGGTHDLEMILADIVQLSTVCGRVGDEARDAVREGLWSWRSDPTAYHAHRRVLDPTLPPRRGERRGLRRPWFTTLDAGVRQCRSMERLIAEETPLLQSLLGSASTIAVTRDARAQETLSLVATVGGVLFGLPALILTLYGATSVLPITRNSEVLLPLVAAGVLASAVGAFLPGRDRRGRGMRFAAGIIAMVTLILLLLVAGTLVTPKQ